MNSAEAALWAEKFSPEDTLVSALFGLLTLAALDQAMDLSNQNQF